MLESFSLVMWVQESWQHDQLSFDPGQIQGFKLVYPSVYPISELLEFVTEPVLQIPSCRHRATTGYMRGVPVRIQY